MNLQRRKNIRLKEYDYSQNGYYFVTICTKNRKEILSKIIDENIYDTKNNCRGGRPCPPEKIKLTNIGKIIDECWNNIKYMDNNININQYIIMPNHIHGIIEICGRTETSVPTKYNTKIQIDNNKKML